MRSDRREWVEVGPAQFVNPFTGGIAEPSPCGWCGRPIIWAIEGHHHVWGTCLDPEDAIERATDYHRRNPPRGRRRKENRVAVVGFKRPVTAITIAWPHDEDGEFARDMSRALAEKISERFPKAEVTVRTFRTVPSLPAPAEDGDSHRKETEPSVPSQ